MRSIRHRSAAERLGVPGVAGSAALHALVVATFLFAGGLRPRPRQPPVYRVNLVGALGTEAAARPAAPAPATPARPAPTPPAPRAAPARPAPRSNAPAVPIRPSPARPAPAPATAAPAPAAAAPSPSTAQRPAAPQPAGPSGNPNGSPGGTDAATIRTEGVEFPFPGYLHNLVAQVFRRWSAPASNTRLAAEVFFLVHRDGSVSGLQFIRRSGSFSFDLEAQGAIEAAARAAAFGALPAGYGPDVLPVSFYFNPGSAR